MSSHSNYLLVAEPGDRDRRPTCGVVTAAECECEGDPPPLQTQSTLTISRSTHNPQHSTSLTTHTLLAACCSGMENQNFHIRLESSSWVCPAPAPPPACGRLPRLDHSTITLPGSTRLAPDTHHWSHITPPPQPVSRWPVPMFRQSPVCWPAQCPGCGEQQQPTKTIIPWLPPHRRP